MTIVASTWLALSILLCAFAWMASRRFAAFALPLAVTVAAVSLWIPTGSPRFTPVPPGHYAVLGADIQVDIAIFVLLKPEGGQAVYYRTPYSSAQANALQGATDEAGEGGGVTANVGQDGGVQYDGPPPVQGGPPKSAEQPAVTLP